MNFTIHPRGLLIIFMPLLLSQNLYAQYFRTGIDPTSIRWEQINTESFRFLYPKEAEKQVQDYCRFLNKIIPAAGASLNHIPRKFPLILHSYSALSNGYTIMAPRRIELFPRPPVIGGAESYSDHLLIHEVRHLIQMDMLHTGFTKYAYYLMGDQAVAAVLGLHVPSWFMEGDAVLAETLLSESGRGRQALFSQDLRALWLDGNPFSYDKAFFGSYKDYVPNHYVLGYHMVSMGRLLGNPLIWSDGLTRIGKNPIGFSLLSRHLKQEIGLNRMELYEKTVEWATSYWASQERILHNQPHLLPVRSTDEYTNYIKPVTLGSGEYLVLKNSLGSIPEFVRLSPNGEEEHLLFPGPMEHSSFSVKNGQLIWAEHQPDIRWSHRSFSSLYTYDLETGQKRRITHNKRFFSPDLNTRGTQVACLEYLKDGSNNLVILDAGSGAEASRVSAPTGTVFEQLYWDEEGFIWLLSTGRLGKAIWSYSITSQNLEPIVSLGFKEVMSLVKSGPDLFLIGPSGSTNAVYAYNLDQQQWSIVSEDSCGIQYLSFEGKQLTASVYRTNGYRPALIHSPSDGKRINQIPNLNDPILPLMERVVGEEPILADPNPKDVETKRYYKMLHWFHFHSWAPVSLDISNYRLRPGIMVLSQNDLGTAQTSIAAEYNLLNRRIEYRAGLNFIAGYPEVDLTVRTYHDQSTFNRSASDTASAQVNYRYYGANTSLSIPLDFSSGRWYQGLISAASFSYNSYRGAFTENGDSYTNTIAALGIGVKAYSYSRLSGKDLYPKLGFIASLTTSGNLSSFTSQGRTYVSGSVQTFLPGLFRNHSTRLYLGGYLNNQWYLPDQSPLWLPRGLYHFDGSYSSSGKLDYAFPFAYPDWNLGSILYVKRLKANVFCDAAFGKQAGHEFFLSTGIDLTADFYFLRMGAEIDGGIRAIYNATEETFNFEILFDFAID